MPGVPHFHWMTMAYSSVVYTGNGSGTLFAVTFPYLERSHVSVALNGVTTTAFTWLSDSLIQMTSAPANGVSIRISRNSNRQARLTDFQDAQSLTEQALDYDANQCFYVAQEAYDAFSSAGGGGDMLRANNLSDVYNTAAALTNLGAVNRLGDTMQGSLYLPGFPQLPQEAATKGYVDYAVSSATSGPVVITGAQVITALTYTPVNKAGDTMTGPLILNADPASALSAATKQYVDNLVGAGGGTGEWLFRMPIDPGSAAALLNKTVAATSNAAGAANLLTNRNGGQAMANFAINYKVSATTTANSDIGLTSYVFGTSMNGGGLIGTNTVAAGPRSDTGPRRLLGLDVRVGERAADQGLQRDRNASNKISIAAQFGPDNSYNYGDGAPVGYNASFGVVLQASNDKSIKSWVPLFIEQDATAPGGLSILARGGSSVGNAPAALMEVRDNFTVGIDFRNSTMLDADKTAIWLAQGQAIHFGPLSRMYADPFGELTFYDPISTQVKLSQLLAGIGTNLLPLNNTWTGANTWQKLCTTTVAQQVIKSENNGALPNSGITYLALAPSAFEVRKTTNLATEVPGPGGISGAVVQHYASGAATANSVQCGIRVQMDTVQTSSAGTNDAVGAYIGFRNQGTNVGGFGIHADAYHSASGGNSTTYGLSSEMYRTSAAGFTVGLHARSIGGGFLNNDYGVLVSPGAGAANNAYFLKAFAAGSFNTGYLLCQYGLDLRYATSDIAAIAIASNKYVTLDDGGGIRTRFNSGTGMVEWSNGGTSRFGFNMTNGTIYAFDGVNGSFGSYYVDPAGDQDAIMSVRSAARTDAPSNWASIANWLAIRVDGFRYKIPLYL
jgi:hypothetical protein